MAYMNWTERKVQLIAAARSGVEGQPQRSATGYNRAESVSSLLHMVCWFPSTLPPSGARPRALLTWRPSRSHDEPGAGERGGRCDGARVLRPSTVQAGTAQSGSRCRRTAGRQGEPDKPRRGHFSKAQTRYWYSTVQRWYLATKIRSSRTRSLGLHARAAAGVY